MNKFWSLVFFFFLLLVPNDLQSLLAPNPHSKRIKFNNELLYTMFDRVYNDMNPVQFKEYYKTSRETLYVLNEKKESQISIASNILAVNSSGQSKNIQKYKNPPKDVQAGDLRRCENTLKYVQEVFEHINDVKEEIEGRRNALFEPQKHILKKQYEIVELNLLDKWLEELQETFKSIQKLLDDLKYTYQQIRKRVRPDEADIAERKRKARVSKESKRREKARKLKRKITSANKVTILMCNEALVHKAQGQLPKLKRQLTVNEFKALNHKLLKPKMHLNGFEFLITLNAFPDECSNDIESIVSVLKHRRITCASKQNVQRRKAAKQPAKSTILNWLKKSPNTTSDCESEDDNREIESQDDHSSECDSGTDLNTDSDN